MATKLWVGTDSGNAGKYGTAANWSPSGVPTAGDDVYFIDSSQSVTADFDQSAVALASFNVAQSYTGTIATYLQIASPKVRVGYNDGPGTPSGSAQLKLDLGSGTAAAVVVENTGTPTTSTNPALYLKAAHASTTIEVRKGKVGIAFTTGETSTVGTITSSYTSQQASDADVYIGSGVTLTTLKQVGSRCTLGCAATTVTQTGGTLTTVGTGAITTVNANGGTANLNSTGTITTLNIGGSAVDMTKSLQARTVTTAKLNSGSFKFDPAVVTLTNKVTSDNTVTYTAS
jgi:hypothetical protein